MASAPVFLVGYYGQAGTLVFACAVSAWWARRRGHPILLGLFVACAMIKPQLGLCAALPMLWGSPRRAWYAASVGGLLLIAGTLTLVGTMGVASYVHVLHAFSAGSSYRDSAVDGLALNSVYQEWLAPNLAFVVSISTHFLVVAAIAILLIRYRARPSDAAIATLVPLLVLVLPYSHQYDSVMLLPTLLVARGTIGHERLRVTAYWAAVLLITVTPAMALAAAAPPFRLLPLGLIVWCVVLWPGRMKRPAPVARSADTDNLWAA